MAERGGYRATFEVLLHHPEFVPMGAAAKHCFHALKLLLGASGIAVCYQATVSAVTSLTLEQVTAGEAELEARGWIAREGAVVWLVNGLRYEPHLNPRNPNHRASVRSHLATLPRIPLVARFRDYYAWWLAGQSPPSEADGIDMVSRYDADTIGIPSGSGERRAESGENSTPPPARHPIVDEVGQFTSARTVSVVFEFLEALPSGQSAPSWLAEIRAWRDGLNLAQQRPATEDDIACGLGDYLALPAKDFNRRHVRRFIEKAREDRERPPARAGPRDVAAETRAAARDVSAATAALFRRPSTGTDP